jgi:hypothetical protein
METSIRKWGSVVHKFIFVFAFCFFTNVCNAQSFSFTGIPSVKVTEGGIERNAEKIEQAKASSVACIIKEIDGKFFWETRGSKPLLKIDSGAFIIFFAIDGSGYVRLIKPSLKEAASVMSNTEKNFDYVEHLILGLRSVTYYGKVV